MRNYKKTNICKFGANKDNCKWKYCITKSKKIRNRKLCDKKLKTFVKYWFKLENYTLVLSLHTSWSQNIYSVKNMLKNFSLNAQKSI